MKQITSKQRAYLKSLAQKIDSIFQVGKNGVTPELTEAIALALEAREMVKLSVLNNCLEEPKDIANMISERTRSILVQVIGKKIVLYKPSKEHAKIILPKA
jgi:RNA-binding protein